MTVPTNDVPVIAVTDIVDLTQPSVLARTASGQALAAVGGVAFSGLADSRSIPLLVGARGRVRNTVQVVSGTAQGRVVPALQNAGTRLSPRYVAVRDSARIAGGQLVAGAVRVRPILADAGGRSWDTVQVRVVPVVRGTRDRLSPVLVDATARGGTAARTLGTWITVGVDPVVRKASRRGTNVVLALRGGTVAPAASRARTVRRLITVAAAAGLSYGAWRALAGKPDSLWKTTAVDDRFHHANGTDATPSDAASSERAGLSLVEDADIPVTDTPVTDPLRPPELPVIVLGRSLGDQEHRGDFDMTPPGDPSLEPPLS